MIAHTAKVMPILSSVLVLIGFFLTSCVGINLGDIPRGLRHPRDVPSVDPSTLGRKTLYALASLKYCYNDIPWLRFILREGVQRNGRVGANFALNEGIFRR